jgi:hypothetical protein
VESDFGCRVFSVDSKQEFLAWLEALEAQMTSEHVENLSWGVPGPLRVPQGRRSRPLTPFRYIHGTEALNTTRDSRQSTWSSIPMNPNLRQS